VRTKELGIRMAVGATKGDIVKCVLASGVAPLAFGIAVGIALAGSGGLLLARVLQKAALPMGTNNPWIYAAVALGLSIAAAGAMLRPALRAAQCDPAQALRSE
jgi:putative ABC transport system permease protein